MSDDPGLLARLRAAGIRPRSSLGQNFLHDPSLLRSMVAVAELRPGEPVFEVGTGPGTLTRHLAEGGRSVLTVEIDPALAAFAASELGAASRVEILEGDVLDSKSRLAAGVAERLRQWDSFAWVSNLPYGVASPLILTLLGEGLPWRRAVLTVQLEVAQRFAARPGEPAYGSLTLLAGFWARARVERRIGAGTFWPRPGVESAVLVLDPVPPPGDVALFDRFRVWVRLLWGARRKQVQTLLRRSLGDEATRRVLDITGWDPQERPERLGPEGFITLARRESELELPPGAP